MNKIIMSLFMLFIGFNCSIRATAIIQGNIIEVPASATEPVAQFCISYLQGGESQKERIKAGRLGACSNLGDGDTCQWDYTNGICQHNSAGQLFCGLPPKGSGF